MKKLVTLIIALALMVLPLMSAVAEQVEMAVIPKGEFPLTEDMVEIECLIGQTEVVIDYNTNDMTKKMEALTNVKIKWNIAADAVQTKSMLLASGALPDVFLTPITNDEQVLYGELGMFVDLSDYIEQYGVNIKDMFAYDQSIRNEITLPSGKIVSLPSVSYTYHMTAANKMWMNRNWLAAVDKEVPTTLDELYEVMVAFRDGDPNGNGAADEIAASGVGVNGWHSIVPFFMSAFIATDNQPGRYFVQPYDGTVDVVFNKDEWREGLTFLNKLYNEKLIDQESFTQDTALRKQKVEANTIGICIANAPSSFCDTDTEAFTAFDVIAPVVGPNGVQSTGDTTTAVMVGYATITSACENPEIAFRWLDVLYDQNVNLDNIMGNQGVEWRYAEEGELGINGEPALWANLPAFTGIQQNVSWYQTVANFRSAEWRLGQVGADEELYLLRAGMESRLYDSTTLYTPYKATDVVPNNLYISADDNDEYSDIKTALYEYMYECTANFIVGNMSIENDWDNYIAELDRIGLDRYLELVQGAIS